MSTTNAFRLAAAIFLLIAIGAALWLARDDDKQKPADLQEYFGLFNAVTNAGNARFVVLEQQYPNTGTDAEQAKAYYAAYADAYDQMLDDLDNIDAPSTVKDAHEEFIAAGREVSAAGRLLIGRLADAQDIAEIQAAFNDDTVLKAASVRQESACIALRDEADKVDIEVPQLKPCGNITTITVSPTPAPSATQ